MATNIKSYPNLIDGTWETSSTNTCKEQRQAAVDFYTRIEMIYVNHG